MVDQPPKNLQILLACMPKSGSTYLSHTISRLPEMRREHLVPGYQRREQELDEALIVEANHKTIFMRRLANQGKLASDTRPLGWIAQHHTRYSEVTGRFLRVHNVRPVVLVRNIFDIVPSLYDHLNDASQFMSMGYVEEGEGYERETFLEFIAEMVIPWYFNFFVSWSTRPDVPLVTYEELIADPEAVLTRLFNLWNVPISPEAVTSAVERANKGKTRKNKAIVGRGAALPEEIKRKIASYAKFYPKVDFGPIGL